MAVQSNHIESAELLTHLSRWRTHLRWQATARWLMRGIGIGAAAALGCAAIARLTPLWDMQQVGRIAATCVASGAGLGLLWAWLEPRPLLPTARWLDQRLGLAERTSTALELLQQQPTTTQQRWVLGDALQAARTVRLREQLPLRLDWREWVGVLCLLALLVLAIVLPNPQLPQLLAQRQAQQAQQAQIEAIQRLKAEINTNTDLTEAQKAALIQPLDKTIAALRDSNPTLAEQATILNNTNVQLQALAQDPTLKQQLQALQQAGGQLAENSNTAGAGQAMQAGNLAAAAQQLSQIDPSKLTAAQQQQLAQQLQAAAQQVANSNPQLAAQLQAAATALQQGNATAAQQALQTAAQTLQQMQQQLNAAQLASQTAQQLAQAAQQAQSQANGQQGNSQNGQQGNSQNGQQGNSQNGQQGNGQNGQQGNGQNGQQGNGQNGQQGNGQNGQQGGGQQGSGSGSGSGQTNGNGQPVGSDPVNQNNGAGDGGETNYETIYAPERLGGSNNNSVQVDSNQTGDPNNQIDAQVPSLPNGENTANVPYNQVFGQYNSQAQSALEGGEVPVGLRGIVRDYFSALEP